MGAVYNVPFVAGAVDISTGSGSGTPEAQAFKESVLSGGLLVYDLVQAGYPESDVYYVCDSDQSCTIAATANGFYRYGTGRVVQINDNATPSYIYTSFRFDSSTPEWINLRPISGIDTFATQQEAYDAIIGNYKYPITYRLTNCSAPTAPVEAAVDDTVNVDFVFPEGYGIVNPSSDIYVTNNGVTVTSSYANGRLTFTMPDPSQ